MSTHYINNQHYTLEDFEKVISSGIRVELGENAKDAVQKCYNYLHHKLTSESNVIYGINTGFGSLCNTVIGNHDLEQLQLNLVRSHSCGVGAVVSEDITKRILLLKAIGLSKGHSGVQIDTIEQILFLYNENVLPIIYEQGSLGASGDLAPLAHMSLSLIGEGEVIYKGIRKPTSDVFSELNRKPVSLKAKEGLALLNGTQFMSAFLSYSVATGIDILNSANNIASISLDALEGISTPFNSNVNSLRNQEGQIKVAKYISERLKDSELFKMKKEHVQDPYSLRCIPQIHGASLDAIDYCKNIVENEMNAVTDNPTIFPDTDEIISAGNFHGQPLALSLDFLAIAISELGSNSERRTYKLIAGDRGLPAFLVKNPGLNSGLMIAQYSCASLVSQNKQLCTPASVDTIDSSNGQEDHVSMGANAGTKLFKVIQNVKNILGIELLCASQAMEFRRPLKSSAANEELLSEYRKTVPFIDEDRVISEDIRKSSAYLFK
ncbi:histidine ammonia-lyase [Crocinitomicaceae bacterium]|nr:histidine ammonia-lyase [Crocinitomicaceae bacterium]